MNVRASVFWLKDRLLGGRLSSNVEEVKAFLNQKPYKENEKQLRHILNQGDGVAAEGGV